MAPRKLFLMAALALGAAACDGDVSGPDRPHVQGFWARAAADTAVAPDSVEQATPHRKRIDF